MLAQPGPALGQCSPNDSTDNDNMIMLPDVMFLNLIDLDLQKKIALSHRTWMDMRRRHLNSFWRRRPHLWQQGWTTGWLINPLVIISSSTKARTTYHGISNCGMKLWSPSMTTKRHDTQKSLACTTQCNNTTGGPDCAPLSRIMCRVVVFVNNSRSTDRLRNRLISQSRGRHLSSLFLTALWTWSWTFPQQTDMIPSWSW